MSVKRRFAVISAQLPADLRDTFAGLARRRNLSVSGLLRSLVERELSGAADGVVGEVESALLAELSDRGVPASARSAAAVNLARRMDRDPASGAANAAELRRLLLDLAPSSGVVRPVDVVDALRLRRAVKALGFELVRYGASVDVADTETLAAALGGFGLVAQLP